MVWTELALLVVSVAALLLLRSWRLSLLGLLLQYGAVSGLMVEVGLSAWATIRLGVGALVIVIIWLTLTHEAQHQPPGAAASFDMLTTTPSDVSGVNDGLAPTGLSLGSVGERFYQIGVLALTLVIAYGLAGSYPFPAVSPELSFAAYWLGGVGLLGLMISRRALRLGFSLLLLDSAIQLLGSAAVPERRLIELSLGGGIAILLALAISFLIVLEVEASRPPEGRQGR